MDKSQQKPDWMSGLRRSNGIGWIAFGLLIVAILVGALTLGRAPPKGTNATAEAPASQAVR